MKSKSFVQGKKVLQLTKDNVMSVDSLCAREIDRENQFMKMNLAFSKF